MILPLRRTLVLINRYSAFCMLLSISCRLFLSENALAQTTNVTLTISGYVEKRGQNVMVFSNKYGLAGIRKFVGDDANNSTKKCNNKQVKYFNPTLRIPVGKFKQLNSFSPLHL